MKRNEEKFILDILENIDSINFKQLIKETHENNIMLKQIIKVIRAYITNHNNENINDFERNILANVISNFLDINKIFNK